VASKILKGAGKLLGIGGKKKAATEPTIAAPAQQSGPIISPLDQAATPARRRPNRTGLAPTILSEKLGS
jgi:hypothetical protein